jgi:hypothetical protein
MLKTCPKCEQDKSLADFHKNRNSKDGHAHMCKPCAIQNTKFYYDLRDRDERLEVKRAWQDKNREHVNFYNDSWRKNNPEQHAARQAERRARKNKATPNWLSEDQRKATKDIYKLSKKLERLFGVKYHVDHIVPLKGENICGLHVPWNLQILEASLNLRKSNKFRE